MRLALFEPDIPQNTGSILRLAACFGVPVDIIEPCGFPLSHRGLKRAGMDYLDQVDLTVHPSWSDFEAKLSQNERRLILLTTQGATPYLDISFDAEDTLLLGRESAGVPPYVHERADLRAKIPMVPKMRSFNVAIAAGIVLGEALRQVGTLPQITQTPNLP